MKIVQIKVGTQPGEVIEETVVFAKDEPQPDGDGWLDDDGYHYQKDTTVVSTDGSVTWRRRPDRTVDTAARATQLYASLVTGLQTTPELTATEARNLAGSIGAKIPAPDREKVVRQFLRDHFRHAIRFCESSGLVPKSGTTTTWSTHRKGGWPKCTLRAAAMHMSQDSEASDMVSLALSEGALLHNGDRNVSSLIFGGQGGHAKHICVLLVPVSSVVTPGDVADVLDGLDRFRSTSETEVLFYGAGLSRYLVRTRKNPYTRDDQDGLQGTPSGASDEEEYSDEELPTQTAPSLDTGAITANWTAVLGDLRAVRTLFVDSRDYGTDWKSVQADLAKLTEDDDVPNRAWLGAILRPLDDKISTLPMPAGEKAGADVQAVRAKWAGLFAGYRS